MKNKSVQNPKNDRYMYISSTPLLFLSEFWITLDSPNII